MHHCIAVYTGREELITVPRLVQMSRVCLTVPIRTGVLRRRRDFLGGLRLKTLICYRKIIELKGNILKFSPLRGAKGRHFVARRFAASLLR